MQNRIALMESDFSIQISKFRIGILIWHYVEDPLNYRDYEEFYAIKFRNLEC